MLAVDTNVVVRYFVDDDALQVARAKAVIDNEELFVSTTVLLETEWVLRDVYDFSSASVFRALTAFAGLPNITVQGQAELKLALDWMRNGLDFADALHLSNAEGCDGFLTFDRSLVKSAKNLASCTVRFP